MDGENRRRHDGIMRPLYCTLTEHELRDRAVLLAKTTQDIAECEERAASVKAQLKSELQALQAQQNRLAAIVARGEELRDVRVDVIYDYESKTVQEWREDLGVLINERRMTDAEAQMPLLP